MAFIVEVTGVPELKMKLSLISTSINPAAEAVLDEVAQETRWQMIENAPQGATGNLRGSINVTATGIGERKIGPTGSTGSRGRPLPAGYAKFVEYGNVGHWPNVTDIAERLGFAGDDKISFLVARAISRRPGPAYFFASRAMESAKTIFNSRMSDMIKALIS